MVRVWNADDTDSGWTTVRYQDVLRLVPHAAIRTKPRCHTFRVFATGSVVQVGRWPRSMFDVCDQFLRCMYAVRPMVMGRHRPLFFLLVVVPVPGCLGEVPADVVRLWMAAETRPRI